MKNDGCESASVKKRRVIIALSFSKWHALNSMQVLPAGSIFS